MGSRAATVWSGDARSLASSSPGLPRRRRGSKRCHTCAIKKQPAPPRHWPERRTVQDPLANPGPHAAMQPGSARYEGLLAEGYYHYQGRLLMLGSAGDRHAPGAKSSDASAHSASDLWQPLWSDRFMLVVDKGPDLLSVPGKANPECLISGVTQRSDFARARIVHRLDRDTSGCMVLALTDKTHRSLSMAFQDRRVGKTYRALVSGWLQDDEGRVDLPIGKNPAPDAPAPRMIIDPDNGRPSSTLYRVLARMDTPVRRTLVELVPLTGRTHQLRLHMKALGHPILGDTLHAPPDVAAECSRLCLHAHSLALEHPVTGEQLRWECVCPF
mmetsp:Transcript_24924/g.64205  ORF Transcript_24924/g.64205 Transcript_24924/m.64205 type:complete len:328 (+) Transcript_24924:186-1169(+)